MVAELGYVAYANRHIDGDSRLKEARERISAPQGVATGNLAAPITGHGGRRRVDHQAEWWARRCAPESAFGVAGAAADSISGRMGTTFVRYHDRGFWMRDGVLELWLRLLARHLAEPTATQRRSAEIREGWLLALRGYFNGCVPVLLDEAMGTAEGEALVRGAIISLLASLGRTAEALDHGTLNLLGIEGEFLSDFPRDSLVEVGRAWIDLLDGRVGGPPSDSSFMPGSGR